jgi:hypothetical protein
VFQSEVSFYDEVSVILGVLDSIGGMILYGSIEESQSLERRELEPV